jgi:hypothetical protein
VRERERSTKAERLKRLIDAFVTLGDDDGLARIETALRGSVQRARWHVVECVRWAQKLAADGLPDDVIERLRLKLAVAHEDFGELTDDEVVRAFANHDHGRQEDADAIAAELSCVVGAPN